MRLLERWKTILLASTLRQTAVAFRNSAKVVIRGIGGARGKSSDETFLFGGYHFLGPLQMSSADRLSALLESEMNGTRQSEMPILLPCCYDGLTARLIGATGAFEATFLTGFGVSAVNGYPDTQLVSFAEMQQQCTIIAEALGSVALEYGVDPLPCIAVSAQSTMILKKRLLCVQRTANHFLTEGGKYHSLAMISYRTAIPAMAMPSM
jgi:Phosphoenolpyruvate phosphomutase